jgi:hypothetical protein
MKGKFIYSMILFAGLLFAGSDFLYAQTQNDSMWQNKTHSGTSKYSISKGYKGNMNEMQDTSKNYQYKSSKDKDYKDMQDTSKWRNQDRYREMYDSSGTHQYPGNDKGGIDKGGYQNQGDYSDPDGKRHIQNENEGDIQYEDGYAPMKDTTKWDKGSNYDNKSKDWNNDKNMNNNKKNW